MAKFGLQYTMCKHGVEKFTFHLHSVFWRTKKYRTWYFVRISSLNSHFRRVVGTLFTILTLLPVRVELGHNRPDFRCRWNSFLLIVHWLSRGGFLVSIERIFVVSNFSQFRSFLFCITELVVEITGFKREIRFFHRPVGIARKFFAKQLPWTAILQKWAWWKDQSSRRRRGGIAFFEYAINECTKLHLFEKNFPKFFLRRVLLHERVLLLHQALMGTSLLILQEIWRR